jgi:hypothetical protein
MMGNIMVHRNENAVYLWSIHIRKINEPITFIFEYVVSIYLYFKFVLKTIFRQCTVNVFKNNSVRCYYKSQLVNFELHCTIRIFSNATDAENETRSELKFQRYTN